MSQRYVIEAVGDPREWSNDHGAFYAYPLTLSGIEGTVEWSRKTSSRKPEAGERLVGDIVNGQRGKKIKVDLDATKEANGSRGSTSSSGSRNYGGGKRDGWQPEGERDPEKVARIGRAHAQEMALRFATSIGKGPSDFETTWLEQFLTPIIDWFQADVDAAAKAAQGAGNAGAASSRSTAPREASPAPAQDSGVHQRIDSLLREAGVDWPGCAAIADYACEHMTDAEQTAAIERLQNENTRPGAVNRLKERTESHLGEPLPCSPEKDDDIPF